MLTTQKKTTEEDIKYEPWFLSLRLSLLEESFIHPDIRRTLVQKLKKKTDSFLLNSSKVVFSQYESGKTNTILELEL